VTGNDAELVFARNEEESLILALQGATRRPPMEGTPAAIIPGCFLKGTPIGFCGQAPSDLSSGSRFLGIFRH